LLNQFRIEIDAKENCFPKHSLSFEGIKVFISKNILGKCLSTCVH
jgi:hypothetical protein